MLAGIALRDGTYLEPWSRDAGPAEPLIIAANHSSWWDAVVPLLLSLDHFDHDAYGIMDRPQLERYGFFRRVGMFSIDQQNPRAARRSLGYAAELLRGHGRVLWLFPQGEIVPNDRRPILCRPGIAYLLRLIGPCRLAPVAFRYELLENERPTAFVRIGTPERIATAERPVEAVTTQVTELLTHLVDDLRDDVVGGRTEPYVPILRGRKSINNRWDRVRGKL